MKIVHITTIHGALDVRIFYKECKTLAEAGHEVHEAIFDPPCASLDGITFHAIEKPRRPKYFPCIFSRLRNALAAARRLRAEVYHFHDAELVPVGIFLKLGGATVIYDVHEDSPQEALSINRDNRVKGLLYFAFYVACNWMAKWILDGMVVATPGLLKRFPPQKAVLVQNFPVQKSFRTSSLLSYAERQPLVVYVGNISKIRGIKELVQAMPLVAGGLRPALALAGKFDSSALEKEVKELPGWKHVNFVGWLPPPDIGQFLNQARAGVVILHPTPEYLESQPVKLYEYMAAGLPIIASDFPLWRQLYGPIGCCLFVDPLDPVSIGKAIQWVLENPDQGEAMGRLGAEAVRIRYNWEEEGTKLLRFYDKVLT